MNLKRNTMLIAAFALLTAGVSFAQSTFNPSEKIPLDPNVRYGKLENGITYYVLHNEEPKDRASFYIVQNVGAVLENDNQNGLAHFLEHMAFNGTKNYPKKGLLDYLEKYGVAFGRNINAYTSTDETVYNLSNVPVENKNVLDSALLILHDWSNYLSLENEEIDSERGVIREEWRTRRNGGRRVYMEKNKVLYKGSMYEHRDVIGDLDVINNFKYKVIKDFYHDWYRTDLQAIVVVGDVDAARIEGKIKEMFAHIPAVKNPRERVFTEVPGNKEPLVGIITDPEASRVSYNIYFKHEAPKFEEKNLGYYREGILQSLYSSMIGDRYEELLQKENPPFVNGYAYYYNSVPRMDVYTVSGTLNETNIVGGIEALLTENERVVRHGFLNSELDRAKKAYLSRLEKRYKERNKQHNDRLVQAFNFNYLLNEPAPGIAYDFEMTKKLLPGVTVEEINALAKKWNTKENIVVTLTGPEKEGLTYPTEKDLLAIQTKVQAANVAAYEDKVIDEPLIATMPKAGKVTNEKQLKEFNAVEWTLANGAKVVVKQTDFKENEIMMQAFSKGGSSLYPAKALPSIEMMGGFMGNFGVSKFDVMSLQKLLTGKVVRVNPFVSSLYEGFRGSSSIQDFETMLQLVHLYFENPRFDEQSFKALQARYMAFIKNMNADVNKVFQDSISLARTDHNERTTVMNSEYISNLDFETMERVYKERFADASDFTFVFVGNIDAAKAKPMIETYLGSLKSTNSKENWKDNGVSHPKKDYVNTFARTMETPKTSIFIDIHGKMEYNAENRILLDMVSELLDKRYTDVIREKEGGTYGVGVYGSVDHYPTEEFSLIVKFDTDPKKAEKLKGIVYAEIEKLFKEGVKADDLNEAKKNFIKEREENLRRNGYWMGALNHYYKHNEITVTPDAFEEIVNKINAKQVEKFAKKYLGKFGKVEVIMIPAS